MAKSHKAIAEHLTALDLELVEHGRMMLGEHPTKFVSCLCGCGQPVTFATRTMVRVPSGAVQVWRKDCAEKKCNPDGENWCPVCEAHMLTVEDNCIECGARTRPIGE